MLTTHASTAESLCVSNGNPWTSLSRTPGDSAVLALQSGVIRMDPEFRERVLEIVEGMAVSVADEVYSMLETTMTGVLRDEIADSEFGEFFDRLEPAMRMAILAHVGRRCIEGAEGWKRVSVMQRSDD